MYVSHQALRILGRDRLTAAQQREADEQLGRMVAALTRSRRRFAGRTLAGGRAGSGQAPIGKLSKGRSAECRASGG
jgi:hypothetical protein